MPTSRLQRSRSSRRLANATMRRLRMDTALSYVIKFVGNMDEAVRFHTAQLGLKLRFQSPEWSEFDTGSTTLALHLASAEHPPGTCQPGFTVADIERFYADRVAQGVRSVSPPT